MKKEQGLTLHPRFRVMAGTTIALGPGKIALLRLVAETGSIRNAAVQMGMSYMRAWTLIRTMNRCFKSALVTPARGGQTGGGAVLTPLGRKIVDLYLELERASERACAPTWRKLRRHLA
jgi:molybdate transport system regulatory protein